MVVAAGVTGLAVIGEAVLGAGVALGAGEPSRGAPTAISHRWPGWPCAGFNLPLDPLAVVAGAAGRVVVPVTGVACVAA